MSKNTLLSELINYVSANSSGNVTIAAPSSGYALDVTGTGRFTGQLTLGSTISNGTYTYTLPGATGTLALTSALSAYLPLAGGTLTGGLNGTFGNFSSYVNAQTIDLSNSTASNALRITHTNGSYHAVSIIATGNSALYASGSVTVVGTIQATSTIIAQAGLSNGAGQSFTLPSSTGTLALTSQLSSYLPLSGGTLTGALSGTSATFSGNISAGSVSGTSGYRLKVEGLARFEGANTVLNYGELDTNNVYFQALNTASNASKGFVFYGTSEYMRITSSGYVGIGTTSPSEALDVVGTINVSSAIRSSGEIMLRRSGNEFRLGSGVGADYSVFYAGGSERMRITSSGNVGIGLTNPQTQFHINGVMTFSEAGFDTVRLHKIVHGHSDGNSANNYLAFQVSDGSGTTAERMRINGDGNLLLTSGTTVYNTSGDFYLRAGTSGNLILGAGGSNGLMRITSGGDCILSYGGTFIAYTQTSGTYGMIIQNLSNNTSATAMLFRGWNGSTTGSIATYVNLTTYNTSSDYRLKEDLKQFSGLDLVSKLKMYDFKWKEADWRMYGGLAHEIQEVLPYAVTGIKDGKDTQGVDYSTIVPLLIQSIKELKAELDTLKNK